MKETSVAFFACGMLEANVGAMATGKIWAAVSPLVVKSILGKPDSHADTACSRCTREPIQIGLEAMRPWLPRQLLEVVSLHDCLLWGSPKNVDFPLNATPKKRSLTTRHAHEFRFFFCGRQSGSSRQL